MSFGKLLATAMESVEDDNAALLSEVANDPVQEVAVETPDEAAQSTAQVEESYATVDQAMEAIDEALASAQTLDKVADSMVKIEASGGMDENMAAVAEVAIESLYKKLGVKKSALLAMETYSSEQTRKSATALALENIQETAKKVWQAILNMLKQAYEFVKNFFKAVFDKNTKITNAAKAKLETLKKFRADNNIDDSVIDGKIENETLATALNIDGKVDLSSLEQGFLSLRAFLMGVNGTTEDLKNLIGEIHSFVSKITEKDIDIKDILPELNKLGLTEVKEEIYSFSGLKKNSFGNSNIYIRVAKNSTNYDIEIIASDDDSKKMTELSILSLDDIEKTLELIIIQSKELDEHKSIISELENIQKSLEKETNAVINVVGQVNGATLKLAKDAIIVVSKLSIKINTVVSKYAISSLGHVLHYVDLCMKEHKIATEAPVSA